MTEQRAVPIRMSEVVRLTNELADRILDAQIMKRPVREDQARALASAARLLHDHGMEWPPTLTQVLHELAQDFDEGERSVAEPLDAEAATSGIKGLTRFLSGFRKEKDQQR